MENFIPFLIGIALFIFKVWSDFKKEQEKARKRNPAKPVASDVKSAEPRRSPQAPAPAPQPFLIEESTDSSNPYEPKYKHLYEREKRATREYEDKVQERACREVLLTQEGYNPEQAAEEVKANRKIHKNHKHQQIQLHEEEPSVQFDMRNAVIAEAILNRPQF